MLGAYAGRSSRNECSSSTSLMTVRTSYDAVARAGTADAARAQARSTGSSVASIGGSSRWFDGQVREQRLEREHRVVLVGDDERRDAALALVDRGAAEAVALAIGTPVNATTTSGPLTYANASLVMITWSAMPSSSAGPDTAGPDEHEHDRHDTRRVGERLGDAAPRVQRGDALVHVGARAGDPPDDRDAELDRRGARPARSPAPSAVPIAPRCLPPSRLNQLTVRPSISRTTASTAALRCPKTGVRSSTSVITRPAPRMSVALWPPNPNEFDSTGLRRSAGARRTRRRGRCRRRSARGWRWAGRRRRAATAG